MYILKRLLLPISITLLFSLGCQFAARLSPINIKKPTTSPSQTTPSFTKESVKRPPSATPTPTLTRTLTPTPNFEATSAAITQTAFVTHTKQAHPMAEEIQKLHAQGYLSSIAGNWHKIDNFDLYLAETTGYHWQVTGYQPVDFIIQAKAEWWSADETTQLFNSGCGFIFRAVDKNNRLAAVLTMDGKARYDQMVNGEWRTPIFSDPVPINSLHDQAHLMLIAEGDHLTFIKDGVELLAIDGDILSSPKFQGGDLSMAIMSGTDTGFGIHCKLTDIELWIIR
ncbi:MAG: hypothetical protein JW908_12935 [Anaerolineales bacterium]|nr:hypothetical protein [Anaerolineales bacterium]